LEDALLPMLEKNIDTVVLGCTHYPFVIPLIQEIAGEGVRVIDPAPAVAKQTMRLLEAKGMRNATRAEGYIKFYTSGDPDALASLLPTLLGESGEIRKVEWLDDLTIITTEHQTH
jgi:glutamate racemase